MDLEGTQLIQDPIYLTVINTEMFLQYLNTAKSSKDIRNNSDKIAPQVYMSILVSLFTLLNQVNGPREKKTRKSKTKLSTTT